MSNHGDDDPAQPNKARLRLPTFEGKENAQITRGFIAKVDGYKAVTRLSDEETAQAVAFAMLPGSPADLWLTNLAEHTVASTESWDTLKPLLLARFTPTLTASEKAAAVDACKQQKGDNVLNFLDKCEGVQLMLDRDIPRARKTGNNRVAYLEDFQTGTLGLFLRGLREEGGLKAHVNGALGCTTLEQYKDAAVRYERHITKQVKVTVAELKEEEGQEEPEEEEPQEVANLKGKKGQTRKYGGKKANGKNGGNGNQSKGAKPKAAAGGYSGGNAGQPQRRCYTCNSPEHLARECPKRDTAGRPAHQGGHQNYGGGVNELVMKAGVQALMHGWKPAENTASVNNLGLGNGLGNPNNPNPDFW